MRVFIIHGAYGSPDENWFPWLKKELVHLGHEVIAPKFPTPKNQTLENWMEVFKPYLAQVDEETVFIGHSLAPAFILSILEKINVKVKACFFVAGFTGLLNHEIDSINRTFIDRTFDWKKINCSCKNFFIYLSDNDPYVPLEKGKQLGLNLKTKVRIVEGAGHFNKTAGYTKFDLLLEDIKKI